MINLAYQISAETPSKKNSRIINTKTGRSFPNKKYTAWHKAALEEIELQNVIYDPIDKPVSIFIIFTHGDLRRRDSDNGVSSILDLLTDAGILSDDNWQIVRQISVINKYEKNKPSCVLRIKDYELPEN